MDRNKTVLISGGSRGIGAAMVRRFSEEGYRAAFLYNESEEEAAALSKETGALPVKCDVSDHGQAASAVRTAMENLGTDAFDDVVLNAGVSKKGLIQDLTDEDWERMRGVNLDGMINVAREVVPGMVSEKTGSIILISSIWGRSGASCEAAYSATKAGVIGFGQALSKELGPSGVRVNIIAPGVIETGMNSGLTDGDREALKEETPLGRFGKPEEVAELALFLSSEKAAFITGQTVGIDGGFVV